MSTACSPWAARLSAALHEQPAGAHDVCVVLGHTQGEHPSGGSSLPSALVAAASDVGCAVARHAGAALRTLTVVALAQARS